MPLGTCALCLNEAELQESHFLSAAVYRILRCDPSRGNPNPWEVTTKGSRQTSRQVKVRLLCWHCEQRLSTNGEHWVFTNGLRRDGSFRLMKALAGHTPVAENPNTKIYRAIEIPEINITALTYFALSMFWKGSIHPWNSDGSCPVSLGMYKEPVRQYLLRLATSRMSLWASGKIHFFSSPNSLCRA